MNKTFNAILFSCLLLSACAIKEISETPEVPAGPLSELYQKELYPFYFGVASGDPLENSVILWTKIKTDDSQDIEVLWEIAEDENFENLVNEGKIMASAENLYTIKVDATGLKPGTKYFYRFKNQGRYSPVGRTRTLPAGDVNQVQFAVVSCSNWEWGYFNAYRHIAEREDLNAVIHLGDYIYEYGPGSYGDTTIGRIHEPRHEIISLNDYRIRYSQYRLDKDLQQVHQLHPFINIWDDHEIANNAYTEGAQNHQPDEGSYEERKNAARKAYYEWMPVRENQSLYRRFQFGELATLLMLDERLAGRTKPAKDTTGMARLPEDHTMLGQQQLHWLLDQLKENDVRWHIIGNQVVFSYLNYGRPDFNINPDSWDGYPKERDIIIDHLRNNEVENLIFLTGDTHSSLAFEVIPDLTYTYDTLTGAGAIAVEFGTTSVNSGNANERFATDSVELHERKVMKPLNPHLKYINMRDHGYLLVTLTDSVAKAEWYYVSTLRERNSTEVLGKALVLKHGDRKLEEQ